MARTAPVKVPSIKVKRAKELQAALASQGRYLSLYDCLLHIESSGKGNAPDPFKRFRL